MPIYSVSNFSALADDIAYVEAADANAAGDRLAETLDDIGVTPDMLPRDHWDFVELSSPICVVVWTEGWRRNQQDDRSDPYA
jgi:hypothetical protein